MWSERSADLCRTSTRRRAEGEEFQTSIPQWERITGQYGNYPAAVQQQAGSIHVRNQISFHSNQPDPLSRNRPKSRIRASERLENQPENNLLKVAASASFTFTSANTFKIKLGLNEIEIAIFSHFISHETTISDTSKRVLLFQDWCSGSDKLLAVINQQICKLAD